MDGITVIDVFRAIRVEPTKDKTWSVGLIVANQYIAEFGRQPPKENRTKTCGVGVHCFAIYPHDWFDRIAEVIKSGEYEEARQFDLFE